MAVMEIVRMLCKDGETEGFKEALDSAITFISDDPNCHGATVYQGIENPHAFEFLIEWSSVETHQAWRGSEPWARWRALTEKYRARPNETAHYMLALTRGSPIPESSARSGPGLDPSHRRPVR